MDINQIRYFLALTETLNFTRAAEQCFVSQPALTQAIKRLEEELGGDLIVREGRYTRLTGLGRMLRGHFEKIEQTRQTVKEAAQAYASGSIQELHIGLMCTIGPRVLGRFLTDFQQQFPSILLFLHDVPHSDFHELLRSGALDGVFRAIHDGRREDSVQAIPLFEEPMVVAFHQDHSFSQYETVRLIDIAQESYVDRLHCEFRDGFISFCQDQSIEPNITFRSEREDWIQSFIREGVGVSILPRYSLLSPPLDHRPVTEPALSRRVELLVADHNKRSDGLSELIGMVEDYPWSTQLPGD